MSKIKQIKQKTNGTFPNQGIPLGADGINIDMSSGLNLEEEFIIGGNHSITITEDEEDNSFKIIESYKDKQNETLIYQTTTDIKENQNTTTITVDMFDYINNIPSHYKTISITENDGNTTIQEGIEY